MFDVNFYKNKKVFVTGHTGFKGSWLSKILARFGAQVTGYALEPNTDPNLFAIAKIGKDINSVIGDIRNYEKLKEVFDEARPEIVFHLAAQPLVLESYRQPRYTYETNVMGTVNILECVRNSDCVKSFLNVTTDKVYLNRDLGNAFHEEEPLDGYDPYSNSKSCSELVTHSYKNSFFAGRKLAVSTARAGNVIGGGDFAENRIIPDCVRAALKGETITVRNPNSTRPYQHVLEPLFAYLMIAQRQYCDESLSGWYNIGPDECDCVTTGELTDIFCKCWGDGLLRENRVCTDAPHEAGFLKLDSAKIKHTFDWRPVWHTKQAVQKTVEWTKTWQSGADTALEMDREIKEYMENAK